MVLDRLLEQAGTVAYDAAGQSEARAHERPSPDSHQCGSMQTVCFPTRSLLPSVHKIAGFVRRCYTRHLFARAAAVRGGRPTSTPTAMPHCATFSRRLAPPIVTRLPSPTWARL